MKKNIIMLGIIIISAVSLLLVMYYIKTKDIKYISSSEINEYTNISMTVKSANGTETSLTRTSDLLENKYYKLHSNCGNTGSVTWSNASRTLKIKVSEGPLKCTLAFIEVTEDINVVAMKINNVESSTVPTSGWYNMTYSCVNENNAALSGTNLPTITWDPTSHKLSVANIDKKIFCTVNFTPTNQIEFGYTGSCQKVTFVAGHYLLQVWGAQGGSNISETGGYGAYARGVYSPTYTTDLYICVGGQGKSIEDYSMPIHQTGSGGFNGGGRATVSGEYVAGGGGATHIAGYNAPLADLIAQSYSGSLIIAAAGGGGSYNGIHGGDGGGSRGNDGAYYEAYPGYNGTGAYVDSDGYPHAGVTMEGLSTIAATGSGEYGLGGQHYYEPYPDAFAATNGGGGGWMGGGASARKHGAAGGGISFINTSLLTTTYGEYTKSMYCYNCQEDSREGYRTYSTTNVSEVALGGYAKIGDGYAAITKLD